MENSKASSFELIIESNSASEIFGPGDALLKELERQFPQLKVHARGSMITLVGNQADCDSAKRIIEQLTQLAATGFRLGSDEIKQSASMVAANHSARPADILSQSILSSRGKNIRPKTLGQKSYVDAIDNNTIVFGIGPAGTGKTYLAMAKAVQALQRKEVSRIILTRPAVEAGERLGFLPGTLYEKIDPYMKPLYDALFEMMGADALAARRVGHRFGEVARHDFRLARHDVGKSLLECARNLAVQLLPAALEQALIGRIPHQRVLEAVDGFRRLALTVHELRLLELGECILQCALVASNQHAQQGIGELAPDGAADLADLLHRRQAVEPRHQRVLKGVRDGERRQRPVEPIALGLRRPRCVLRAGRRGERDGEGYREGLARRAAGLAVLDVLKNSTDPSTSATVIAGPCRLSAT